MSEKITLKTNQDSTQSTFHQSWQKVPGLYESRFEHDACGFGFVANIKGVQKHQHVIDALTVLENMEHRGACGCENNTGDGAGIATQIPHEFFKHECEQLNIELPNAGDYAVGMLFFPKDGFLKEQCRSLIIAKAAEFNLNILGFRKVPINKTDIGDTALSVAPIIEQIFIEKPHQIRDVQSFERKLYVFRKHICFCIDDIVTNDAVGFYVSSLSCKTITYKGQLTSHQVRTYFPDLSNPLYTSAYGLVHSRFATNTFPSWRLAQPFRYIAHNGEINTLQGNLNWLKSAEKTLTSSLFTKEEIAMLLPIVSGQQSDSACLDNVLELLVLAGRSLPHVMMMLIPEAWDGNDQMQAHRKSFYEYHASIMEPWDGPAAISFTNGDIIGATLDRNGLRPARYCITNNDTVLMASESGVLPIDPSTIIKQGRLQAGKMFVIDFTKGAIITDEEIKKEICTASPYEEWLTKYKIKLEELDEPRVIFSHLSEASVSKYQQAFGYSKEDIETIIKPMALDGKEPIGSMGTDVPLAVLSNQPQHLSSYFKQLFAQVTNPPIDPIRERMVMSLATFLGNNGNLLEEAPTHCHMVALKHPVLTSKELEKLRSIDTGIFQSKTLQTYFRADGKPDSLEKGLARLCRYAEDAVEDGFEVIILSDRAIDSEHVSIPSLLATSAVHHHLISKGVRGQVGLVVEAGDVWEVHHFACLIGFGATAINPYLALATIRNMKTNGSLDTKLSWEELRYNYIKSVNDGLLKIFSKMGVSTLQSYQAAQLFEIVGLNSQVVNKYFTGGVSRIEGLGLEEIAQEALAKHRLAFHQKAMHTNSLPVGGIYQWKRKGEAHLFNPNTIHYLQLATRQNNYDTFKKYSSLVNQQEESAVTLRSLLQFKKNRKSISIDEVEPAENIYKRFATGAMSLGSISPEAHATLAKAMNILGGKSNTGEGGEDEARFLLQPNGDNLRSSIKQVASGRFGVTSNYLTQATELQIKMAQGAKPGEGGQLPGDKVDEYIGKLRYATPGVGLISPPPHHDIYSIEDLAQLIFDLKNANRAARINVKLVSKAGVGTIAAGVTKAKADVVLVSGNDGGTGASPISSIKHAGLPWELGLAETHQTLVKNKLRSRVVVQTDGQLKTGRDIAIATLLGAEEWGVATAALVVEGCIMMRKCQANTCPVGIATQDKTLRARFTGQAEHVINLFKFLTQELREIMAELGFRTVNEMVGQADCLVRKENITHWKAKTLNLTRLLYKEPNEEGLSLYQTEIQDHLMENILDWKLLDAAQPALQNGTKVKASFNVINTDRTIGTLLSNEISKKYFSTGLPQHTIHFKLQGIAGQSFGAFNTKGITLELEGGANDYFGKGLCGATLITYPNKQTTFVAEQNILIGNVAFYGATSGQAFIKGMAGERFAVRNSGAEIVVEGVGAHGCEYMTGGLVIILGKTGKNFAAGMSGGLAFVYDVNNEFEQNCNKEMVYLETPTEADKEVLYNKIKEQAHYTNSNVAQFILSDFDNQLKNFVKVFPKDYKKVLEQKAKAAEVNG
ncbi:MAG: glutamate synthase large subunit [Chitinophagaceae bacterium]